MSSGAGVEKDSNADRTNTTSSKPNKKQKKNNGQGVTVEPSYTSGNVEEQGDDDASKDIGGDHDEDMDGSSNIDNNDGGAGDRDAVTTDKVVTQTADAVTAEKSDHPSPEALQLGTNEEIDDGPLSDDESENHETEKIL